MVKAGGDKQLHRWQGWRSGGRGAIADVPSLPPACSIIDPARSFAQVAEPATDFTIGRVPGA
jgi:hypothetical protein